MGTIGMVFTLAPEAGALYFLAVRKASLIPELVSCVSDSTSEETMPSTVPTHAAWKPFSPHTLVSLCLFCLLALDECCGQLGALPLFPSCGNPSITKVSWALAAWGYSQRLHAKNRD